MTVPDDAEMEEWPPFEEFEPCGAVFPLKPGQDPCSKPKDHHLGPDTDWKRHEHSNGLLKWRVDGADIAGDVPTAAAARAILGEFGITRSRREQFAERMEDDPMGVADDLAAKAVTAIRHAERALQANGEASR